LWLISLPSLFIIPWWKFCSNKLNCSPVSSLSPFLYYYYTFLPSHTAQNLFPLVNLS
jgi:hypothetical protein